MILIPPYASWRGKSGLKTGDAMSIEDEFLQILYWIIVANNYRSILEIGTGPRGFSTWWLTTAAAEIDGLVHTVDPTNGLAEKFFPIRKEPPKLLVYSETSDEFFSGKTIGKFDFILIDGDHSYEQCKKDFNNSVGALFARGGMVALHDTIAFSSSVGKFVQENSSIGKWCHWPVGKGMSIVQF